LTERGGEVGFERGVSPWKCRERGIGHLNGKLPKTKENKKKEKRTKESLSRTIGDADEKGPVRENCGGGGKQTSGTVKVGQNKNKKKKTQGKKQKPRTNGNKKTYGGQKKKKHERGVQSGGGTKTEREEFSENLDSP